MQFTHTIVLAATGAALTSSQPFSRIINPSLPAKSVKT